MQTRFYQRPWFIVTTIVVLALVIIAAIISARSARPLMSVQPVPSTQPVVLTHAMMKEAILATAKINIPPIATSTLITTQQLPVFMRTLILPQATGTIVHAVLYKGSQLGYEITYYTKTEALQDAYKIFTDGLAMGSWLPTQGMRGSLFAYVEFSGSGLVGRAEFTLLSPSSTAVIVQVMQR